MNKILDFIRRHFYWTSRPWHPYYDRPDDVLNHHLGIRLIFKQSSIFFGLKWTYESNYDPDKDVYRRF